MSFKMAKNILFFRHDIFFMLGNGVNNFVHAYMLF